MKLNETARLRLEREFVDVYGARNVVTALARIAEDKAARNAENWQDDARTAEWTEIATALQAVYVPEGL